MEVADLHAGRRHRRIDVVLGHGLEAGLGLSWIGRVRLAHGERRGIGSGLQARVERQGATVIDDHAGKAYQRQQQEREDDRHVAAAASRKGQPGL